MGRSAILLFPQWDTGGMRNPPPTSLQGLRWVGDPAAGGLRPCQWLPFLWDVFAVWLGRGGTRVLEQAVFGRDGIHPRLVPEGCASCPALCGVPAWQRSGDGTAGGRLGFVCFNPTENAVTALLLTCLQLIFPPFSRALELGPAQLGVRSPFPGTCLASAPPKPSPQLE